MFLEDYTCVLCNANVEETCFHLFLLELARETTQRALPARSRPGTHTQHSREHSGHDDLLLQSGNVFSCFLSLFKGNICIFTWLLRTEKITAQS